jgi:hypothetical protein
MATMQQQRPRSTDELTEIVHRYLADEHGVHVVFDAALPEEQDGDRTVHELDYADFALAIGLAVGIARSEDPYELLESVNERARAAATAAFERWGHWSVTYEQDRAARAVPTIYPGTMRAGREVPWEPIEDVANAMETIEPLVGDADRERIRQMSDELQRIALRVREQRSTAEVAS